MKLIDLNRDGGIGANSLFIQLGDLRILVDCGLNPKKVGRAATPEERPRLWELWRRYDGEELDAWAARRPRETAVVILEPR